MAPPLSFDEITLMAYFQPVVKAIFFAAASRSHKLSPKRRFAALIKPLSMAEVKLKEARMVLERRKFFGKKMKLKKDDPEAYRAIFGDDGDSEFGGSFRMKGSRSFSSLQTPGGQTEEPEGDHKKVHKRTYSARRVTEPIEPWQGQADENNFLAVPGARLAKTMDHSYAFSMGRPASSMGRSPKGNVTMRIPMESANEDEDEKAVVGRYSSKQLDRLHIGEDPLHAKKKTKPRKKKESKDNVWDRLSKNTGRTFPSKLNK